MTRLHLRVPELSRELLVNPHRLPFREMARAAGATDLRENLHIEKLPGGYSRMIPLDPTRKLQR